MFLKLAVDSESKAIEMKSISVIFKVFIREDASVRVKYEESNSNCRPKKEIRINNAKARVRPTTLQSSKTTQ